MCMTWYCTYRIFVSSREQFDTLEQARSVLVQVTYALAVAETALQFEHRDLHWGNVLVKATNDEYIEYLLDGKSLLVKSYGVKVSIIDFTLSRLFKGTLSTAHNFSSPKCSKLTGDANNCFSNLSTFIKITFTRGM